MHTALQATRHLCEGRTDLATIIRTNQYPLPWQRLRTVLPKAMHHLPPSRRYTAEAAYEKIRSPASCNIYYGDAD